MRRGPCTTLTIKASSTELKDWLAAARKEELVRRTAHWMSEALTDTGPPYREDPGLTGLPIIDALVASAVETVALRRASNPEMDLRRSPFPRSLLVPGPAIPVPVGARARTRPVQAAWRPDRGRLAGERLMDLNRDPDRRTVFESPGCSVTVPSAQYLLAMKVYAARVDRDADDIRTLAGISALHSADEVLDLAERYLAGIPIPAKVKFLVEELFDEGPRAPTT